MHILYMVDCQWDYLDEGGGNIIQKSYLSWSFGITSRSRSLCEARGIVERYGYVARVDVKRDRTIQISIWKGTDRRISRGNYR